YSSVFAEPGAGDADANAVAPFRHDLFCGRDCAGLRLLLFLRAACDAAAAGGESTVKTAGAASVAGYGAVFAVVVRAHDAGQGFIVRVRQNNFFAEVLITRTHWPHTYIPCNRKQRRNRRPR